MHHLQICSIKTLGKILLVALYHFYILFLGHEQQRKPWFLYIPIKLLLKCHILVEIQYNYMNWTVTSEIMLSIEQRAYGWSLLLNSMRICLKLVCIEHMVCRHSWLQTVKHMCSYQPAHMQFRQSTHISQIYKWHFFSQPVWTDFVKDYVSYNP